MVCRGNNRQTIFRNDHDRKRYLEKLSFYCEEKEVELLCYCLLSNHVHLVLDTPKGNLSKMMQAFERMQLYMKKQIEFILDRTDCNEKKFAGKDAMAKKKELTYRESRRKLG